MIGKNEVAKQRSLINNVEEEESKHEDISDNGLSDNSNIINQIQNEIN